MYIVRIRRVRRRFFRGGGGGLKFEDHANNFAISRGGGVRGLFLGGGVSQNLKIWPIDISFRQGGGGQCLWSPITNKFIFIFYLFI